MQLYIANKNYSTWSLRAWIMLEKSGVSFEETKLNLETLEFFSTLKNITPTAKVPCLVDGDSLVWESLAICEYISETYLSGKGWPSEKSQRAKARALASEMHAGFNALRNEMPMNIRAKRKLVLSEQAQRDIQRIEQIFMEQYEQHRGWLFGEWSIVDAMYAPVVLRFQTYGIELNELATAYMQRVLECPALQKWVKAALEETEWVEMDEAGEDIL